MDSFFHGWRRKVGCTLLVISLLFMIAWIRSFVVDDFVAFPFEIETRHWSLVGLAGESQSVVLYGYWMEPTPEHDPIEIPLASSVTTIPDAQPEMHELDPADALSATVDAESLSDEWIVAGGGISIRSHTTTISCSLRAPVPLVIIPFRWFVIPLTLVSAFLILWKPRKRETAKWRPNS